MCTFWKICKELDKSAKKCSHFHKERGNVEDLYFAVEIFCRLVVQTFARFMEAERMCVFSSGHETFLTLPAARKFFTLLGPKRCIRMPQRAGGRRPWE